MHRTFSRNFDELLCRLGVGATLDRNGSFKAINVSGPTLNDFAAILAVRRR